MKRIKRITALILTVCCVCVFSIAPVSAATVNPSTVTNIKSGDVFYVTFKTLSFNGKVIFKDTEGQGAWCTATVKIYNTKNNKLVKTLNVNTNNLRGDNNVFSVFIVTRQKYKIVVSKVVSHNGAKLRAVNVNGTFSRN